MTRPRLCGDTGRTGEGHPQAMALEAKLKWREAGQGRSPRLPHRESRGCGRSRLPTPCCLLTHRRSGAGRGGGSWDGDMGVRALVGKAGLEGRGEVLDSKLALPGRRRRGTGPPML